MGKLVLIVGGARSGKSFFAQQLAQNISDKVAFVATAEALDDEMAQRIMSHQKSRPQGWITIEASTNIGEKFIMVNPDVDTVIVDCLTLLVSNYLMKETFINQAEETDLELLLKAEFDEIMTCIRSSGAFWIIVTNEVGSGIVPVESLSRKYRDALGRMNQWVAAVADEVYYLVAGIPIPIHQFRK